MKNKNLWLRTAWYGGIFLALILINTLIAASYGESLWICLPASLGFAFGFGITMEKDSGIKRLSLYLYLIALVIGCIVFMISMGIEGLICGFVATAFLLVISIPGFILGLVIGAAVKESIRQKLDRFVLAIIVIGNPAAAFLDASITNDAVYSTSTEVVTALPPDRVWARITGPNAYHDFGQFYFRKGIAHPLETKFEADSQGNPCIFCHYSLGQVRMPIDSMVPGRLIRFHVAEMPEHMRELSIYSTIYAPHLHDQIYMKGGQIKLIPLPNGGTRLVATTRYTSQFGPPWAWNLLFNHIFNEVHEGVLSQWTN